MSRSRSSNRVGTSRPTKQVYTGLKHIRNKINNTDSKPIKSYNDEVGHTAGIFDIVSSHNTSNANQDTLQYYDAADRSRDKKMATLNLNLGENTFSFS